MADSFVPDNSGGDSFVPDAPEAKASAPSSGTSLGPKESGYWSARARGGTPTPPTPPPRSIVDMTLNPQGLGEHLASLGITIPATMLTGGAAAGVGIPAALARVAASAGLGALGAANRGDSMTVGAVMDGAIAALTEGVGKFATVAKVPFLGWKGSLSDIAKPIAGFEYARQAVLDALDLVRSRLPKIKFEIPVFGKGKLTPDEAAKLVSEAKGSDYWLGVSQLADALKKSEAAQLLMTGRPKTLGMNAGQIFRRGVKPERFEPPTRAKWADRSLRALENPAARSAADAATTQHAEGNEGWPIGLVGLLGLAPESLGSIASRMGRQ